MPSFRRRSSSGGKSVVSQALQLVKVLQSAVVGADKGVSQIYPPAMRHTFRPLPLFRASFCLLIASIAVAPLRALNPATSASDYSVRGWFTEDGLPSSRVRAALQARDGYLWAATSQGIARFDGA